MFTNEGWTERDIPAQRGRVAIVTGGTAGIGRATALALAGAGAEVIIAGRDGTEALAEIDYIHPGSHAVFEPLDLANLASVRDFAARIGGRYGAVDILVNDAGIMALPRLRVTADGFEMQFGVNHLGHFALTARLLPLLRRGRAARVISVSSLAHRQGRIDFDNLNAERGYNPWGAYAQSKLAQLIFALELQRRSAAGGWGVTSLAAHPGIAMTNLYANGPASEGPTAMLAPMMRLGTRMFRGSAKRGARPILYAATAPDALGGGYYGRDVTFGTTAPADISPQAQDEAVAARLWAVSERLTGENFGEEGAERTPTPAPTRKRGRPAASAA